VRWHGGGHTTWVNDTTTTTLPTPTPPPTPAPTPINYNPVPAITPPGILSLIALLALAGFVVLRRQYFRTGVVPNRDCHVNTI